MRFIADYELSDIPEQEGPEQFCTDFERQDGKYLAVPRDGLVVAKLQQRSSLSMAQNMQIRNTIIQKKAQQNEIEDDTNAAHIKRLKQARQEAEK